MNYQKWLNTEFTIIENKVRKSISNELLQYKDIGNVNLTMLLNDHVAFGLKTYRSEVIRVIDDLYKFEFLKARELKIIKDLLIQNTENAFNYINKYCCVDDKSKNTFINILDNINCIIEFSIEKIVYLRKHKIYHTVYEICMMVASALVGALIALVFQS